MLPTAWLLALCLKLVVSFTILKVSWPEFVIIDIVLFMVLNYSDLYYLYLYWYGVKLSSKSAYSWYTLYLHKQS